MVYGMAASGRKQFPYSLFEGTNIIYTVQMHLGYFIPKTYPSLYNLPKYKATHVLRITTTIICNIVATTANNVYHTSKLNAI